MSEHRSGQLDTSAAEFYDSRFVPSLFAPWAPFVTAAANLQPGSKVLDVACGTGVVARQALSEIGPQGSIIGLDCNAAMLSVAKREPHITWQAGNAEALPFDKQSFDAVLCQFGLMFFEHQVLALNEMWRVLAVGGHLVVAVWDRLEYQPGHHALFALLQAHLGQICADSLHPPYALGEIEDLQSLLAKTSITNVDIQQHETTTRFASIAQWIATEVRGWTLSDVVSDSKLAEIQSAGEHVLKDFVGSDGELSYPSRAHLVVAQKSA